MIEHALYFGVGYLVGGFMWWFIVDKCKLRG